MYYFWTLHYDKLVHANMQISLLWCVNPNCTVTHAMTIPIMEVANQYTCKWGYIVTHGTNSSLYLCIFEQSLPWVLVYVHLLQCSNLSHICPQGATSTNSTTSTWTLHHMCIQPVSIQLCNYRPCSQPLHLAFCHLQHGKAAERWTGTWEWGYATSSSFVRQKHICYYCKIST